MSLSEQLASGIVQPVAIVNAGIQAARKPWSDRDPQPFPGGDDEDGDDNGVYDTDPGEERKTPPDSGSAENILDLRASFEAAASTSTDPAAARALLAIEARLGEITLYIKDAMVGSDRATLTKLLLLSRLI